MTIVQLSMDNVCQQFAFFWGLNLTKSQAAHCSNGRLVSGNLSSTRSAHCWPTLPTSLRSVPDTLTRHKRTFEHFGKFGPEHAHPIDRRLADKPLVPRLVRPPPGTQGNMAQEPTDTSRCYLRWAILNSRMDSHLCQAAFVESCPSVDGCVNGTKAVSDSSSDSTTRASRRIVPRTCSGAPQTALAFRI